MTENLKDTLKIVLKCYKEEKMTEEEVLTILESLLSQNNNGGGTPITYPINVPYTPNWVDTIRYQPYCTTITTVTYESSKNVKIC